MMSPTTYRSLCVYLGGVGASFVRNGRVIATARYANRWWILRIPGHQWEITPDMPTARFQKIPGGQALTHTPVKGFKSWQACAKEIEHICGDV
jgi:hypothetical protein